MTTPSNREQWFLDRIGKRVYRNRNSCTCLDCVVVYKHGLIIKDEDHAHVLYSVECESNKDNFTLSDSPLKYFDTIAERDEFELIIKPK